MVFVGFQIGTTIITYVVLTNRPTQTVRFQTRNHLSITHGRRLGNVESSSVNVCGSQGNKFLSMLWIVTNNSSSSSSLSSSPSWYLTLSMRSLHVLKLPKLDVPKSNTTLIWTLGYEWCVVICGSKNWQEKDRCFNYNIGLHVLKMLTILGSKVGIIEGCYGHLMRACIFTLIMKWIIMWAPEIMRRMAKLKYGLDLLVILH